MRTQAYLLTAIALFTVLTPQHEVSATLKPAELSSRDKTKIVQADVLVEASSGQGELVAQARRNEFGKAEALSTITFGLADAGKIDQALQVAKEIKEESSKDSLLSGITSELADAGKIDFALQVIKEIKNDSSKDSALSSIVRQLISSEKID